MKTNLILLFLGLFLLACTPNNQPDDPKNENQTGDTKNEIDSKLLLGYWYEEKSPNTLIEINDSLIIQYHSIVTEIRYVVNDKKLELERLEFQETDSCCRYATCEYFLVNDTLYIEKFKYALLAVDHPTFIDAKLIRK